MKFWLLLLCLLIACCSFEFAESNDALSECLKIAEANCAAPPVCARLGSINRCQYFPSDCDLQRENCERAGDVLQFHKTDDRHCRNMPPKALLPCGVLAIN